MGRKILAVVVGYITMAACVFLFFTIAYIILGTDGALEPETYDVTGSWIASSIILGLIAAVIGGYVCVLVAKDLSVVVWLAGVVMLLGLALAIPVLMDTTEAPNARAADVGSMEAMQNAKQPNWIALLNPFIGAIGALAGGRLKKTS